MKKGKRYKRSKKRLSNFLWFYSILVILTFSLYTFSRYTQTSTINSTSNIANFNVKVNDVEIDGDGTFDLILSPNANTSNNKIVPGNGYFEVNINPADTEVSIEYSLKFDIKNMPNFKIVKYSLDKGLNFKEDIVENVIKGEIDLPSGADNKKVKLTEENTVNLRIYYEWNKDYTNEQPTTQSGILVGVTISQKI